MEPRLAQKAQRSEMSSIKRKKKTYPIENYSEEMSLARLQDI